MWCPVELIEKMLSLQPERNWILAVSCNASTRQVPISTNVAFKKLTSFPGMATHPLGAVVNSATYCVFGLSSLGVAVFLVCLCWLWQDAMLGWSFSVLLWNKNNTFLAPLGSNEMSCIVCFPHHHRLHLASVVLAFPPWPPTFSCLETCFQLRLATYYVLSDTFWQIQFDFTLEVFLDLILLLWKVIKRVVLFKDQILSHLLMGLVLFLKMSIYLNGTIHGLNGIRCKQRHWRLPYSSQWTTQRVKSSTCP